MTIFQRIKFLIFRFRNKSSVRICLNSYVSNTFFEGNNSISEKCVVVNCKFGFASYVNKNTNLSYVKIGRYCSIADNVRVCLGNHPTHFVTTFPAFYYDTSSQIGFTIHQGDPLFDGIYRHPNGDDYYQIIIGNDVWIGSNVMIMGGIKIGDGAIVAAGSVVTKDVKSYSIVGGVPAKLIRMRFTDEIVKRLNDIKWWNWSLEDIHSNYKSFLDINTFIDNNE